MQKIYGYREEDVKGLITYINEMQGKSLTGIFTEYARATGKASGTVRNLYYAIVKRSNEDQAFRNKYLQGKRLVVVKKQAFKDYEEKELAKNILREKAKGKSVRKAIKELALGDEKTALRYQNKYRLMLKKSPEKINEIALELKDEGVFIEPIKTIKGVSDFTYLRLKKEIDKLVESIALKTKKENEYLRNKISILESENQRLSSILYGDKERVSRTSEYFIKTNAQKSIEEV